MQRPSRRFSNKAKNYSKSRGFKPKGILKKKRKSKKKSKHSYRARVRKRKRKRKVRFSPRAAGPNWSHEEPPLMTNKQLKEYKTNDYYQFCYDC